MPEKKIILASQSPRRSEILKNAGYYFVSFPVHVSEIPNENLSLDDQIIDIARRKAKACYKTLVEQNPESLKQTLILASDTMVCLEQKAIGKPENELIAFDTLKLLSGRSHYVKTAIVIIDSDTQDIVTHIETSEVTFKKLSDEQVINYIKTGEPMDKAGSYAIQGLGSQLVEKFVGDYNNVVGLPLYAVERIFKIKNWQPQKLETPHILTTIKSNLKKEQHLLAVSKLQPIEKIQSLHQLGQSDFGENYVQEALEKIDKLKHLSINWHLIGPLQKNKVKYLKNYFAYIHSVDSLELAKLINEKANSISHVQKIFLQVNIADEKTKSGYSINQLMEDWPFLKELKSLEIVGLMAMPPIENSAENNRIYFKKLKELATKLDLHELSMGTSQDYKIALEEGTTWIRIGTVLFGERTKLK